jgi:hypothetical protein
MSELPPPDPAPAPAPAPPEPAPPPEDPRRRRWFVVLACVTLVGFGIFVAAVTAIAFLLPAIQQARSAP